MPTLTDLPEIVGFFSYSREDDEDANNSLSALRTRIQNELRARLGRSRNELRLWQDQEAIAPGTMWESQIELAIKQSVFFVPIITPRVVNSKYCGMEFHRFLEREHELGRDDLVFPILYIDVPELEDERRWRQHPVLKEIGSRQYVDWRDFRYELDSPPLRRAIANFCGKIVSTLQRAVPEPRPAAPRVEPAPIAAPPAIAAPAPPPPEVPPQPRDPTPPQPKVKKRLRDLPRPFLIILCVLVALILAGLLGYL